MLDSKSVELVKSTIPTLKTHGEEVTKYFYKDMFERYPQVQSMFDMEKQKNGKQPKALAKAVLNAAMHIENLDEIRSSINVIAHTHVKLNVREEHYPIVGECLLKAIKVVLGDSATHEILEAWEKAYREIARFYIAIEKQLYAKKDN
ncbi:bacitracin resistance protein BacA [Helicobacter sp. MIT 11-5569]|uniref:globin domain-containing protein n=1 Tax=Helicobacter sp. MIT 11-5569 TaxID=1548151 RepID=UPI00051FA6CF|nr:globin domain-containing protein [Helicobacter sp. MIT 11-5569]TLD81278.1 bacitracin resistance protein BacA [Helicobacter sp. MIT 11-5569]